MLPVGWKQSKQPLLSSCILRLSPLLSHFFTIISCFHPFMLSPPVRAKHCLYGGLQQWRGSDSPRLWHTGSQTPSQVWKWQVQLSESESVSLLSDQSASWRAADRGGGGGQLSRVLVWEDKNRRCRETQSRERGHCGVESWIHFYESTIHFLTVQFSSLLM